MQRFDIWMEGFKFPRIQDESGITISDVKQGPSFLGTFSGENFKDACYEWAKQDSFRLKYFDSNELSFWGCKLHSKKEDAKKSFG